MGILSKLFNKKNDPMEDSLAESVIIGNIARVKELLGKGVSISVVSVPTKDGRQPPVEFPSFDHNFELLHVLWKAKAKPTTPFLEEIFSDFSHGKTPSDLLKKFSEPETEYIPIKGDFSVNKLQVEKIEFIPSGMDTMLFLKFFNFVYQEQKVSPDLEFNINKPIENYEDFEVYFNPEDECSSSMLLFESHNPVDLKRLKVYKDRGKKIIEMDLLFDFEFENTELENQILKLKEGIE